MAQPISAAPGQPYGQRGQQEQAQAVAPMASKDPMAVGAFGPTSRPQEPPTAGVDFGPGPGAPRPPVGPSRLQLLSVMNELVGGDPDIERMIARHARG